MNKEAQKEADISKYLIQIKNVAIMGKDSAVQIDTQMCTEEKLKLESLGYKVCVTGTSCVISWE
jgi:hypothetical protein